MTDTRTPPTEPGAALLRAGRFFRPGTAAPDLHSIGLVGGREADAFYRDRIWMSPQDAEAIGVRDDDWIEAANRNGVVVARAIVSHRMPQGTVYMHHAQERTVNVPKAEATGKRGGIHNSLTRLILKPSHLVGGYAQLSWAFNYLGPTGNQRDEVTVIRRRGQEVEY